MRLTYRCPACWEEVLLAPYQQGKSGTCPKCESEVDAWPAPLPGRASRGGFDTRPTTATRTAPARKPAPHPGWWRRHRTAAVAAGAALLVLPLLAYLALRGPAAPTGGPAAALGPSWAGGPAAVEAVGAVPLGDGTMAVFVAVRAADGGKFEFSGWRKLGAVQLHEEAGPAHKQRPPGAAGDKPAEAAWAKRPDAESLTWGPGKVTAEKGRVEALVFPVPPPGCASADLDLPARAVGQNGTIRLRLPAGLWRAPDDPPGEPK